MLAHVPTTLQACVCTLPGRGAPGWICTIGALGKLHDVPHWRERNLKLLEGEGEGSGDNDRAAGQRNQHVVPRQKLRKSFESEE